jgi:hypothetical protein
MSDPVEPIHCPHGYVIKNDLCMDPKCLFDEIQRLEKQLRETKRERDELQRTIDINGLNGLNGRKAMHKAIEDLGIWGQHE